MVVKFEISKHTTWKGVDYEKTIEAPNLNIAIIQLAMECDLKDVITIYINDDEEENNDD